MPGGLSASGPGPVPVPVPVPITSTTTQRTEEAAAVAAVPIAVAAADDDTWVDAATLGGIFGIGLGGSALGALAARRKGSSMILSGAWIGTWSAACGGAFFALRHRLRTEIDAVPASLVAGAVGGLFYGSLMARTPGGVALASSLGMGVAALGEAGQAHYNTLRLQRAYQQAFPQPEPDDTNSLAWLPDWVPLRRSDGPSRHRRAQLEAEVVQLRRQLASLERLESQLKDGRAAEG